MQGPDISTALLKRPAAAGETHRLQMVYLRRSEKGKKKRGSERDQKSWNVQSVSVWVTLTVMGAGAARLSPRTCRELRGSGGGGGGGRRGCEAQQAAVETWIESESEGKGASRRGAASLIKP